MCLLAAVLLGVRVGLLRLRSVLTGMMVTGAGDPSASTAAAASAAATDGGGGRGGGGGGRLWLVVMAGTDRFGCGGEERETHYGGCNEAT